MLDLHPVTEQQVETGEGILGVVREPDWVARQLPNAEVALEQVIAEGLYLLETDTEFDVLQHFDTAQELLEKEADNLAADPELARRIRGASPPFLLREHAVLRRLRALAPGG